MQTFGRVKYEAVYPGVDLVYYGKQRQHEYDFIVAPKADPDQIKLEFSGSDKIEIGAEGDLILHTKDSEVRFKKPFTYQENENGERQEIASRYVFKDKERIGFEVAEYDSKKPLVIDPPADPSPS